MKRVVTKEDLYRFRIPGNPVLSPDGQSIVYQEMRAREKEDDYEIQLVLADVAGRMRRVMTTAGSRNHSPVWSPCGRKIAFLSNRAFGSQVWLISLDGGEAKQLSRFRYGMHSLVWSPDGTTLFGLCPVHKDQPLETIEHEVNDKDFQELVDKANAEWHDKPKRYDRMYYKSDSNGLSKGLWDQLVSLNVETGEYRQLTEGTFHVLEPTVSPDGQYVAFASNRRPDAEIALTHDVYRVRVTGGPLELLCDNVDVFQLSYSPDGSTIAMFGHRNEYKTASHTHLYLMPADGGAVVQVTKDFPDQLGDDCLSDMRNHEHTPPPLWSADCRYIHALTTREGRCEVVRFDVTSEPFRWSIVIGGDREIYGLSTNGLNRFAIAYATTSAPGKIAVVDVQGEVGHPVKSRGLTEAMTEQPTPFFPSSEVRIDDCNEDLFAEILVAETTPFWYTSEDDWRIHGFVMKPAQFVAGQKYPVILEIHGGPHAAYSYSYFHELQWLAARGYAIVYVNPRGSAGYGQAFVDACRGDYGNKDAADILNGLSAALTQFDFLDGSRVAVTGGSYGGFMTNWLVGHTNQFFAAVSQRSISNWISFYGVSDIGPFFAESEVGGDVMTNFTKLWQHSPLAYVKNVRTPLLLIHNENDLRCPIEQAEQFYTCIKRQGGEVELFRIPNANHDLSRNGKPKLRIARLDAIFNFINDRLPIA